jgi:flagellin-like hook-associated protein FlgL
LQSIRDLTLHAGNGALGGDDRGFIEAELTVLLAEIESLIEARAAAGTALFGAGPVRALAIGDAATVAIDVSREVQSGSRERLRQLTSSPILRTVGARNLVRLGRLCRTVNTPSLLLKTWTVSSM